GVRRLITVISQPRHIYCYIGQQHPFDNHLRDRPVVDQRAWLTQQADKLIEQKTALIGPDLSHQRMMIDKVMNNYRLQQFFMDSDIHQRKQLEKTAEKYLREIASNYSSPVVRFFDHFLSWLWEKLYQGVEVQGLQRLQEVAEGHELIYVPCHRSHMDYLLLSYVIYKQGLMPPHIAAGINLNLPVVGRLLRGAGAFFIRRQFRDNPLYKQVLEAYLQTMCEEGFSIEYFIEGGRSRTGLLLQPKPGMLTMTLRASQGHKGRPIVFVPVYIGYEKLFESHSYIKELYSGRKRKETLQGLIKTRKKLKQSYGKVHLTIGEPFALSQIYDPEVIRSDAEFRECVTNLGTKIQTHINREVVLTPLNILATCLVASPRYAMLADQLAQ
ncbi:MAG: 1-acyl-sn-glycerol-3-phosphate acyltransferase, partial [Cellvibrionales bacterium]|nr:1-acyl-sn-glycerol-3-phosphate acyltransferase [Cellvibrionales bacterium]